MYYGAWIPTPSYNLLTTVFAMGAAASVIAAARRFTSTGTDRRNWRADLDVGFLGACLTFGVFIKPTAFVAIALLAVSSLTFVVGLGLARRLTVNLCIGAATALVLHWAVIRSGPMTDFRRFRSGFVYFDLLGSHDTSALLETDFLISDVSLWLMWLVVAAVTIRTIRTRVP